MFVCCEWCVLSGRGLCDGLITRPEEYYRLWRVVVCDQETSKTRRLMPATGLWKIQPQWVVTAGKQTHNKQTTNNENNLFFSICLSACCSEVHSLLHWIFSLIRQFPLPLEGSLLLQLADVRAPSPYKSRSSPLNNNSISWVSQASKCQAHAHARITVVTVLFMPVPECREVLISP